MQGIPREGHDALQRRRQGDSPLPLWWSRGFPGELPLVGQARSWVAGLLPAGEPLDDLLAIASELAANAVKHTRSGDPGGRFTMDVTWSPDGARVVVGDQGSGDVPAIVASEGDDLADAVSGRGLLLVSVFSAAWGIAGDADARWLWADVRWRSSDGPRPATPSGNRTAELELAALRHAYPGISTWYDQRSRDWLAMLPRVRDASGMLCAPSPTALARMLAARYPSAQRSNDAQPRFATAPVPPSSYQKGTLMSQHHCTCGYAASSPEDLADHLAEAFTPADDTGLDGRVHAEAATETRGPGGWQQPIALACLCGFTANGTAGLDEHFRRVFGPDDGIGQDGARHMAAAPGG